jgi:hypothetical protein
MNVVLNIPDFDIKSVYFTDTKVNTHLQNSTFNRITYSSDHFIMSGVYIRFDLFIKYNEKNYNNNNVYVYYFDPTHEHNKHIIRSFIDIETKLLHKWSKLNKTKSANTNINDIELQLSNGAISVWNQIINVTEKPAFHTFIIKIAGVWENTEENETGLTYKFI